MKCKTYNGFSSGLAAAITTIGIYEFWWIIAFALGYLVVFLVPSLSLPTNCELLVFAGIMTSITLTIILELDSLTG